MWPLLQRDGVGPQYVALLLLWNRLIGYSPFHSSSKLLRYASLVSVSDILRVLLPSHRRPLQAIYAAYILLHVAEANVPPPARLPDIYPVLNVLISTPVFAFAWLWSIKRGIEVGWALGGLGSFSTSHSKAKPAGEPATLTAEANGVAEGTSTATLLSAKRQSHDFRTRSIGYSDSRRSSLRSALPIPSSVSMDGAPRE